MRIPLIIGLFLLPASIFAQQKRDTKVIVIASDTTNLFNRLALAFYERGFSVEQKDEAVKFIATDEKSLKSNANFQYKLRGLVKDSVLTITGVLAVNIDILVKTKTKTFNPVEYRGMKGSAYKDIWAEMESIAKQFGDKISYSK